MVSGSVARDEAVDDGGAELVDGGGGVVGEQLQRPVVPPGAGLDLGAGDEPIGVRGERAGDLVRRHQAGVEAQEVEPLDTGVGETRCECRLDLGRFQQALGTLVGADTGPGRAVIADDHGVVLSREGGDPFGDEPRQRRRVAHVGRAEIGEHLGVAGLDVHDLGADPVADVQHGLLAVLGRSVDHGHDVEVLVGPDLAHLVDVHHHERLEVGVAHRVLQHRPAARHGNRLAGQSVAGACPGARCRRPGLRPADDQRRCRGLPQCTAPPMNLIERSPLAKHARRPNDHNPPTLKRGAARHREDPFSPPEVPIRIATCLGTDLAGPPLHGRRSVPGTLLSTAEVNRIPRPHGTT